MSSSSDGWKDSDEYSNLRDQFDTQNGGCALHKDTLDVDPGIGEKVVISYLGALDQLSQNGQQMEIGVYGGDGNFYASEEQISDDLKEIQEQALESGILSERAFNFNYTSETSGDLESQELFNALTRLQEDDIVQRKGAGRLEAASSGATDQYWGLNQKQPELKIDEELEPVALFNKKDHETDEFYLEDNRKHEVGLNQDLYEIAMETLSYDHEQ